VWGYTVEGSPWDKPPSAMSTGAILVTTNGGVTWKVQRSGGWDFASVTFVDAAHGWAAGYAASSGSAAILATSDGGTTWNAQSSGSSTDLNAITFSDATHGWAVGYGGTILSTTNGGSPLIAPAVTGFTPQSGSLGTTVTITGMCLTSAGAVAFNGAAATSFAAASATQITALVPPAATTGPITVTTPPAASCSACSAAQAPLGSRPR